MIINGSSLLCKVPIKNMLSTKEVFYGTSYGLGEAGYDIRLKQDIEFFPPNPAEAIAKAELFEDWRIAELMQGWFQINDCGVITTTAGRFIIASALEEFDMPNNLVGVVHDKSTWARRGLSVFNTVIEPGWKGFLTLELVYHGQAPLHIPAGSGIAQVVFHQTRCSSSYNGKYQNQPNRPVEAIYEKG